MGMYIAFSNIRIKPEKAAFLFGISMLALLAEALALQHYGFAREHDMYLFLGPAAFFLFCFLINIELDDSPVYRKMRSLSTLIFCIHQNFYAGTMHLGG
jgi:surface polysaccharide O-acyltransferase-like enzyme